MVGFWVYVGFFPLGLCYLYVLVSLGICYAYVLPSLGIRLYGMEAENWASHKG